LCPVLKISIVIRFLNNLIFNNMKDFLMVFRNDAASIPTGTPEQLQAMTQKWIDWIGGIAAQNKLTDRGNRLKHDGKVVGPNSVITDGPYTEIKELILGYSIIKAISIDEATEIAKGCPIYAQGGNVEVREIDAM
jgi:hypothetical protein